MEPWRTRSTKPPAAAGEGPSGSSAATEDPVLVRVADDGVPLEGVIQIEKPGTPAPSPSSSPRPRHSHSFVGSTRFDDSCSVFVSRKLGLLAGGDVFCLLLFSAIGRFSHGLPVLDAETFKMADPFIAGCLLSATSLVDLAMMQKGAIAWEVLLSLPLNHGLLGYRGLTNCLACPVSQILPTEQKQQDDIYMRGNPFELFELLTSLIRQSIEKLLKRNNEYSTVHIFSSAHDYPILGLILHFARQPNILMYGPGARRRRSGRTPAASKRRGGGGAVMSAPPHGWPFSTLPPLVA